MDIAPALVALIAKLDAGHLLILIIFGGREYISWKERMQLMDAFPKLTEALTAVRVAVAASSGKS